MRYLPHIAVLLATALLVAAEKKESKPAPSSAQIQKWVKRLGDGSFNVREEATRNLIQAGKVALDAVSKATKSKDAEVFQTSKAVPRGHQGQRHWTGSSEGVRQAPRVVPI